MRRTSARPRTTSASLSGSESSLNMVWPLFLAGLVVYARRLLPKAALRHLAGAPHLGQDVAGRQIVFLDPPPQQRSNHCRSATIARRLALHLLGQFAVESYLQ